MFINEYDILKKDFLYKFFIIFNLYVFIYNIP